MSFTVRKMVAFVPMSAEYLTDQRIIQEGFAVAMTAKPTGRYRRVWMSGYQAALDDIRAGRLGLVDGSFQAQLREAA